MIDGFKIGNIGIVRRALGAADFLSDIHIRERLRIRAFFDRCK